MGNLYWPKKSMFRSDAAKRKRFENKLATAVQNGHDAVVLSHGGCLDGAGSAIMVMRALGADRVGVAFTQPSDVHRALDEFTKYPGAGRTLHITDLSMNPQHFESVVASCKRLKAQGWRIEWRDHHEKQWQDIDLSQLDGVVDVLEVNEDHTESGASLVQQALCPKDKYAKRLAETIRDRDLWWNKTPDSETLEFAITHLGTQKFMAHCLSRESKDPAVDATLQAAADAERQQIEEDATTLLDQTRFWETNDGERVGVVYGWLPKNVGLHRVLEKDDVQVAINVRPSGHMSIRSRKGADVSQEVAKRFDGGGHPNASGGTLSLKGVGFWRYVLRRGRVPRVEEVAEEAVRQLEAREA